MATNYVPEGLLAVLIGDGGLTSGIPTPTQVSSANVNACVEYQSTTRADVFMKPKTDAQISAIVNPTVGMQCFSSDLGKPVFRGATEWETVNAISGFSYKTQTLTAAEVNGMSAAPVTLLAAPGVGVTYVIHRIRASLAFNLAFANGGAIKVQYGNTAAAAGTATASTIAATFLTGAAANQFITEPCNDNAVITGDTSNTLVSISNATAAFTAGGTSTLTIQLWYSIVPY